MNQKDKFELTGKILLYLIPVLGIIGVTIPFILGQSNLALLGSYLAFPMILSSILYLKIETKTKNDLYLSNRLFRLFLIFNFFGIAYSIYLIHSNQIRPFFYFFLMTFLFLSILLQIILFKNSKKSIIIILTQIFIINLDLIWGVSLNYDFFISRTDPIVHAWYIENLINDFYLTDVFFDYKTFPLWHILCAITYSFMKDFLPIHKIMFFINGITFSFMLVSCYSISIRIFRDIKIALISSLFIAFYPAVILYGMASIPRSAIFLIELLLLLLLLDRNNIMKLLTAFFLTIIITLYHLPSIFFIVLLLILVYIFENIYLEEGENFLSSKYLLFSIVITLTNLLYYSQQLFVTLIPIILTDTPSRIVSFSVIYTPISELGNYLQYSLILFFILFGFFLAMKSDSMPPIGKIFCLIGLLSIPVSFPGPSLLITKLFSDFNFSRFEEYTFLFVCLTGAVGLKEIFPKILNKKFLLILIVFTVMVFLSLTNDFISSDNPLIKRPFYTYYITYQEEEAFLKIASIAKGYILSDYVTTRYLMNSKFDKKSHILEADSINMSIQRNNSNDVILIRSNELKKRPLKIYSNDNAKFKLDPSWKHALDYYYKDAILWGDLIRFNKIYTTNTVDGFN